MSGKYPLADLEGVRSGTGLRVPVSYAQVDIVQRDFKMRSV